jgi:hypothetical protein
MAGFATSFTTIHADDIRAQVEAIYAEGRFWPEPLLQINPSYKEGRPRGAHRGTARSTREPQTSSAPDGAPLCASTSTRSRPSPRRAGRELRRHHRHRLGQVALLLHPDRERRAREKRRGGAPRTRAIIIYPMNALANSQLEELEQVPQERGRRVAGHLRATPARRTPTSAGASRTDPPDILLTNFMMLELLMTRQDELDREGDRQLRGLRFLVLDELHTYRGRQGADVALLVRRVRERLSPERLQCIGTSATMASEGSLEDKSRVVAASPPRSSRPIPESNVIVETLERTTDSTRTPSRFDRASVRHRRGHPADISDATPPHPLAVWVETRLGIVVGRRSALGPGAPPHADGGRAALAAEAAATLERRAATRCATRSWSSRASPRSIAPATRATPAELLRRSSCTSSSRARATPSRRSSRRGSAL